MNNLLSNVAMECAELIELNTFNLASITANELLSRFKLYDTRQAVACADIHMLLLGFGSLGKELVIQAMNSAVMTTDNLILIDIFDKDMATQKELFLHSFAPEMIRQDEQDVTAYEIGCIDRGGSLMKLRFHTYNILTLDFEVKLCEVKESDTQPFTCAVVCFDDEELELSSMMTLRKYLNSETTIAMRANQSDQLLSYLRKECGEYENIITFGANEEILTYEQVVGEAWDRKARQIHERYCEFFEEITGISSQDSWENLSIFLKDSNRMQAVHEFAKKEFLEQFDKDGNLKEQLQAFLSLPDKDAKLSFLKNNDCLLKLAEIEHRRWSYFMMSKGFRQISQVQFKKMLEAYQKSNYGRDKTKNDFKETYRVHSAIVSWEELLKISELCDTAFYDLIPWLFLLKGMEA